MNPADVFLTPVINITEYSTNTEEISAGAGFSFCHCYICAGNKIQEKPKASARRIASLTQSFPTLLQINHESAIA